MANNKKAGRKKKSPSRMANEGLNNLGQRKITQSFRTRNGDEAKNEEEEIDFSSAKDKDPEDEVEEASIKGNETTDASENAV